MSVAKETYNVLPRTSFRYVKANELLLEPVRINRDKKYSYDKIKGEGYSFIKDEDMPMSDEFKGVNKDMVDLSDKKFNAGIYIHVKEDEEKTIHIYHKLTEENNTLLEKNMFKLEKNSKLTVIMDYSSDESITFSNILNKAEIGEYAELNIIKIQRINSLSRHFESRYSKVHERGIANYISVELGGKEAVINYMTDLKGFESEGHVKNVYLGTGTRILDLSHHMNHFGERTNSDMIFKGALNDKSRKAFRGTLDFKRGSTHSEGNEEEFTILLDKNVRSFAIPLLLCEEDDVIGNHAASNGQIDSDKLFYIMSRGFTEKEAKMIIIESHIRPIIDLIPVEEIKEIVLDSVNKEIKGE